MERIKKLFEDRYLLAVIALAFILTAVKRWGVGGSVDPVWYSAVTGNIAKTGDFFHFIVTKNEPSIWDHMPLTYWVIGAVMSLTKVGDFYAKLYPICCSFLTYIFTYLIGKELKDKFYGLMSVLALAFTIPFLKWSGQLKMEVPLTFFFVVTAYFMIRGFKSKDLRFFYGSAIFMALGILTKGPIILAIPLALGIWLVLTRQFWVFSSIHLYFSFLLMGLVLSLLFLPALSFDGRNYFSVFYDFKKGYLAPSESPSFWSYFIYLKGLVKGATIPVILFFISLYYFFTKRLGEVLEEQYKYYWLFFLIIPAVIVPLSFFQVKFDHYMIPSYPFLALVAAFPLSVWLRKYEAQVPEWMIRFVLVSMVLLLIFPIELTGGREKGHINMVNIVKFDTQLANKQVAYLGDYSDDMKVGSEYSFYGNIHIKRINREQAKTFSLKNGYLIVNPSILPIQLLEGEFGLKDCFLISADALCLLTDRTSLQFNLPYQKLPHEIFIP